MFDDTDEKTFSDLGAAPNISTKNAVQIRLYIKNGGFDGDEAGIERKMILLE